jgi:endonuclease/exonuclease/phosphatase family metal-dependent hydrolase
LQKNGGEGCLVKLKIVTYNIRGGRGRDGRHDYARISQFLRNQKIDIALIQEMDTRSKPGRLPKGLLDLCDDHFLYSAEGSTKVENEGWFGNAILSRFPISKSQVIDVSCENCEPRNIVEAFIDTPAGPLHVMNTHKGLGLGERRRQLAQLRAMLLNKTEIPLIVGGDINEWQKFSRALKSLNKLLYAVPSAATFPTLWPFLHLDRLWCRPQGLIEFSEVIKTEETRLYSDHCPLLAEIHLGMTGIKS